ncbi:MAG: hypothetical protein AB1389_01545 [Campylobacterota bacterium]
MPTINLEENVFVNVSGANTGLTPDSKFNTLLVNAAKYGGEHLEEYSKYCAKIQDVICAICSDIDVDTVQLAYNDITKEYGFKKSLLVGSTKWSLIITAKTINETITKSNDGSDPFIDVTVLTNARLSEGGSVVHDMALYTSIGTSIASLVLGIAIYSAKSTIAALTKAAKASQRFNTSFTLSEASEAYKARMALEIEEDIARYSTKTVKLLTKFGPTAETALLVLFISAVVIQILSHDTVWQLTVCNQSDKDLYWDENMEHGLLTDGPYDEETKKRIKKLPKMEIEPPVGPGWPEVISYYKIQLTYSNEKALFGVTGTMNMTLGTEGDSKSPKYNLKFDIPYSGKNSVKLKSDNTTRVLEKTNQNLAYELVDEINNLSFSYSLSAETGKQSVPTINGGKAGYNYVSVLTITNINKTERESSNGS